MTRLQTMEIKLPFAGFYGSHYPADIDWEEEQFIEHHCDESDGDESEWPEALRLDSTFYAENLYRFTSYGIAFEAIAKDFAETFSYQAGEALGISARESVRFYSWADKRFKRERRDVSSLRLTFSAMTSPREYNFETDRVFALIPVSVIRKLWAISLEDSHSTLTRIAKERFTSRDGFWSHYDAVWKSWGPVSTWDHNQLETLLIAASEVRGFDWEDSELGVYYGVSEGAYQAWESAVDWKSFDGARAEGRAEKLAEWIESDDPAALLFVANDPRAVELMAVEGIAWPDVDESALPYRCKLTPDLFPESL